MNIEKFIDDLPQDILRDAVKSIHASHGDEAFFVADNDDGIVPYVWVRDIHIVDSQVKVTILIQLRPHNHVLHEIFLPLDDEGMRYLEGFIAWMREQG